MRVSDFLRIRVKWGRLRVYLGVVCVVVLLVLLFSRCRTIDIEREVKAESRVGAVKEKKKKVVPTFIELDDEQKRLESARDEALEQIRARKAELESGIETLTRLAEGYERELAELRRRREEARDNNWDFIDKYDEQIKALRQQSADVSAKIARMPNPKGYADELIKIEKEYGKRIKEIEKAKKKAGYEGMRTAAAMISVPSGAAIGFGTVRIELEEGDSAYIQFSVKADDAQSNWDIAYLYDPEVIELRQDAFGIKVTALSVGECVLQSFDISGVNDVAVIQVSSAEMTVLK